MAQENIIVNGTFDAGNTGWSGTDLETNYSENAYLGNKSDNHVAELDGTKGLKTAMEQTFKIDHALETDLTFRTALRTSSLPNAGKEGFLVEVLDEKGTVIAKQEVFPKSTEWVEGKLSVQFPDSGTYTLRFSEIGTDDSLGAIIDDVTLLVCFVAGTLIQTARGLRPVEELLEGDLIWTLDAGLQPLRWIGRRTVRVAEMSANPQLRPVVLDRGALGPDQPARQMRLSPQHRILRQGWRNELLFGHPEVLAPAIALVNGRTIRQELPQADVTYVHFLLDGHQIVRSDGVLTESFFPTAMAMGGLDRAAQAELALIFPDMPSLHRAYPATARPTLRRNEAALVA